MHSDDYKNEFLLRLEKSLLYDTLTGKCLKKDTEVITLVESAVSYAIQRTKTILKHMGEFTLHDSDHLFRVLTLMEKLLTPKIIKNLTSPELMLLILSAFFHDIGMSPEEKEIITWRKIWDKKPLLDDNEVRTYNEFKRFYSAKPDQQEIIQRLISQGKLTMADNIKAYLITEYIRKTHSERARVIIDKDWEDKIVYRDTDLTVDLAQFVLVTMKMH